MRITALSLLLGGFWQRATPLRRIPKQRAIFDEGPQRDAASHCRLVNGSLSPRALSPAGWLPDVTGGWTGCS